MRMRESHEITGPVSGTPLPADRAGARVRVPLDSPPSPRWTRAFTGRLMTELVGCSAVAHLRLDEVVQGADIVLDGVEATDAEKLGPALRTAVAAANEASGRDDGKPSAPMNMEQSAADEVARAVGMSAQA